MAQVAVCSQINTKHINTVWAKRKIVGASRNQQALKGKSSLLTDREIPILEVDSSHAEGHVQLWIWAGVNYTKRRKRVVKQGCNNSSAQMVHERNMNKPCRSRNVCADTEQTHASFQKDVLPFVYTCLSTN